MLIDEILDRAVAKARPKLIKLANRNIKKSKGKEKYLRRVKNRKKLRGAKK